MAMSHDDNALIPRTGPAPRLTEGPRSGQRSLYQQHVLDEDTYTEALSTIISRDFFPNLPHIHATNAYLTALSENDPELLSSSIRRLAALAQQKEGGPSDHDSDARQREFDNVNTPYISMPRGRAPLRTPVGTRGWDTPMDSGIYDELDEPGPSNRPAKRRAVKKTIRDDLPLDAFQANYTSEDNASFVQIVDEENKRRKEEKNAWAFEAQQKAEQRKLEGEEKRKMILDAATSGNWRVDANGRRLIGGLAEGGSEREQGEAWKERRLITSGDSTSTEDKSKALVLKSDTRRVESTLSERQVAEDHPLHRALAEAGLPSTALVSTKDGAIVPQREVASGQGDGRGRGDDERQGRTEQQAAVMGDEERSTLPLGGSGADQWGYKTMNNLMFPADANSKPYPPRKRPNPEPSRQPTKSISHANTRLPEEEESRARPGSSRGGSSPARSWVNAAVSGEAYRPGSGSGSSKPDYNLLPTDASPSPGDMPSLLTWGTLMSTPRALDSSDDPLDGRSFSMPETKKRDELGRKLGNKAGRAMNERAKIMTPRPNHALRALADKTRRPGEKSSTPKGMPPPSTPRADALTPAAKRLLDRSLGVSGRNRGAAMEKSSGWGSSRTSSMGWTPSPHRR